MRKIFYNFGSIYKLADELPYLLWCIERGKRNFEMLILNREYVANKYCRVIDKSLHTTIFWNPIIRFYRKCFMIMKLCKNFRRMKSIKNT